ncbi:MAG: ribonuclease P protein subunit [Candidatus Micrarchaeota archaeon]|nr:ribonuclease P protein subunit [Candidatus Micrarchaeota archaeon]MDE1804499.1 ribonuclease P protein subunit [Candidatus Micrarchaeota archaeon]MDE1846444.1 ribonuclease P protein subunit [Candidatus Micrarchaeota archaeon]
MRYNNRNIVLGELIGLKARVVKCLDRKQVGLQGTIIDETKNMFFLETKHGTKKVVKATATFRFYAGGKSYVVKGEEVNFRPEERLEKSMKYYRLRD